MNMDRDVGILSRLLHEDPDSIRKKLIKYASEEQTRMQLMLRDYFNEKKIPVDPHIAEEARCISVIFPELPVEIIQEMLDEVGDQADRSRILIKKLCTMKSEGSKINEIVKVEMFDLDKINSEQLGSKIKMESQLDYTSHIKAQPSTSAYQEPVCCVSQIPTFNCDLFSSALEVFPDACPEYLRSLCEQKEYTKINVAEIVQCLLEGDYPKRC